MLTAASLDSEGIEIIFASNAEHGSRYYCPCCHTAVYLRLSPSNNPHFAAFPGQPHNPSCERFVRSKRCHSPHLTNPETFHGRLLQTPSKPSEPSGTSAVEPRTPHSENNDEVITPITSIADLFFLIGLGSKNTMLGDHPVSDYMITKQIAATNLLDSRSIGPRIIEARPDWAFPSRLIIRFVLTFYRASSKKEYFRMVFDWSFSSENDFNKVAARLFRTTTDSTTGKTMYVAKHERVLIHGDWTSIVYPSCQSRCSKRCCHGKWYCLGYQSAPFMSFRQLFIVPTP